MAKYGIIKNKNGPGFRPVANYTFRTGPSGSIVVEKDTVGGLLLDGEKNLSQSGTAWLDYSSTAKKDAVISDDAYVSGSIIGGTVKDSAYVRDSFFYGIASDNSKILGSEICKATTILDDSVVESLRTEGDCNILISSSSNVSDTSIDSSLANVSIFYSELKRCIISPKTSSQVSVSCIDLEDACLFNENEQFYFGFDFCEERISIYAYPNTIDRSWKFDFYYCEQKILKCDTSPQSFKLAIASALELGVFKNTAFEIINADSIENVSTIFEISKFEIKRNLESLICISWDEEKNNVFDMLFFIALFKAFSSSRIADRTCYEYVSKRIHVDLFGASGKSFSCLTPFVIIFKDMLVALADNILDDEKLIKIKESATSSGVLFLDIPGGVLSA